MELQGVPGHNIIMTLLALKGEVSSFDRKLRTFGPIVLPGLNPADFSKFEDTP
jgi:hypothetical protein